MQENLLLNLHKKRNYLQFINKKKYQTMLRTIKASQSTCNLPLPKAAKC